VATISSILQIIDLFRRILSPLQVSFAKETYNFKEPTNRSHPIAVAAENDLHEKGTIQLAAKFGVHKVT